MDVSDFVKLGFNKNEAKVYLSLVKFKSASANQLIKDTKFHKNIVYDNLEKLIDKGLVSFIIENKRKIFSLASPEMILEYFNEQEQELNKKKLLAQTITKEIKESRKILQEQEEATIFRGKNAVRTFYEESLNYGDYFVFGAPKESVDIMGEVFWENHNLKRVKNKLTTQMIFNPSIRAYGAKLSNKYTKIKYFNQNFEPLTETHIQGDIVAIIVWVNDPLIFKIKNATLAKSYKDYFLMMWKQAKK